MAEEMKERITYGSYGTTVTNEGEDVIHHRCTRAVAVAVNQGNPRSGNLPG